MQTTAQQVITAINAHNYALAAVLALVAVVAIVRKVAPLLHGGLGAFFNSKRGGSLLVLVGGAGGALVTALASGTHLTLSLCVGAIMTAAAASGGWNIVRDLYGVSSSGTPTKLSDTVTPAAPPPVVPPAAALLLFVTFGLLSCATPGGQALGKCELAQLQNTEQAVVSCASNAVTNASDWQASLTQCGVGLASGQLNCVMQALVASWLGQVPAHGQVDPALQLKITRGQTWLNDHGAKADLLLNPSTTRGMFCLASGGWELAGASR